MDTAARRGRGRAPPGYPRHRLEVRADTLGSELFIVLAVAALLAAGAVAAEPEQVVRVAPSDRCLRRRVKGRAVPGSQATAMVNLPGAGPRRDGKRSSEIAFVVTPQSEGRAHPPLIRGRWCKPSNQVPRD